MSASSQKPRRDAALLLCHIVGKDRAWLLAHPEAPLTPLQIAEYEALLERRARHEPIQYILGEQEFYGLRLRVTPAVLIPRPETEHLVEAVLARLPRDREVKIADVGTGSGAIALALAHSLPLATVDAVDLSEEAIAVAEANARALGLADRVRFHRSDLLSAVATQRYDCVASNPPYVPAEEQLEPQVALWEPHTALFAGEDGMAVFQRLLPQALTCLADGGLIATELGADQQRPLARLFTMERRWSPPMFVPDLRGIPRVAIARRLTER